MRSRKWPWRRLQRPRHLWQQIIKTLNDLTTKACNRVYRDERNKYFREVALGDFRALADELSGKPDAAYQLNGAIAKYLKDAKAWDEKVFRLIALMNEAPAEGPGRALLLTSVDSIIAEILAGSAALHELIGAKEDLGLTLMSLVQLFLGKEPDVEGDHRGLISLTQRFAADELQESRTAIANRIMSEFKSAKRLCPLFARRRVQDLAPHRQPAGPRNRKISQP